MGHNVLTAKQDSFSKDIANKKYDFHWLAYKANYSTKGWSMNAIYVEACKLMSNPKVVLRIKEIEDKIKAQEKITLDQIIVKLSQRVNLDVREMFNDDDSLKRIKDMTVEQAMFIGSFEVNESFRGTDDDPFRVDIKKVRMESIKDILDMLMKFHGGYEKDKGLGANNLEAIRLVLGGIKGTKE